MMSQRRHANTKGTTLAESRQKVDDDAPLYDEIEQEEQIQELEQSIRRLGQKYHLVNTSLGCILTLLFGVFACIQVVTPYSLRHHAVFQGAVDTPSSIALGEVSSAVSLAMSTITVGRFLSDHVLVLSGSINHRFTWKHAMNCSIMVTGIQMLYWMAAILSLQRYMGEERVAWGLIWWKPVVPFVWFLLSTRMIDSISKLQIDLGSMHRMKYRHKKL